MLSGVGVQVLPSASAGTPGKRGSLLLLERMGFQDLHMVSTDTVGCGVMLLLNIGENPDSPLGFL